jgi:hypothetical protein
MERTKSVSVEPFIYPNSDPVEKYIARYYPEVTKETWRNCTLSHFGLEPNKLTFDPKTLSESFENQVGDIPANSAENYSVVAEQIYKNCFVQSPDFIIAPFTDNHFQFTAIRFLTPTLSLK